MRPRLLAATIPALAVLLGALASGCGQNGTNAGLTNGPPPTAGEKAAQRNDLPGSTSASPGIPVGDLGDTTTNAGAAGSGSGTEGNPNPAKPTASPDPDSVRANPPAKSGGDRNSAAGGTKPPEPINSGTPRSPH